MVYIRLSCLMTDDYIHIGDNSDARYLGARTILFYLGVSRSDLWGCLKNYDKLMGAGVLREG